MEMLGTTFLALVHSESHIVKEILKEKLLKCCQEVSVVLSCSSSSCKKHQLYLIMSNWHIRFAFITIQFKQLIAFAFWLCYSFSRQHHEGLKGEQCPPKCNFSSWIWGVLLTVFHDFFSIFYMLFVKFSRCIASISSMWCSLQLIFGLL